MKLQEALYNWLTIRMVAEARPEDQAAQETCEFFLEILQEDHHLENLVVSSEDNHYNVHFVKDGCEQNKQFPKPLIDSLLKSIQSEPKYHRQ